MKTVHALRHSKPLSGWGLCLLAFLLAFQALATVRTQAMGRVHRHVVDAPRYSGPALVDFRRFAIVAMHRAPPTHAGIAQRHHHAASDDSVRVTPEDRVADDAAAEDGATQAAALLPTTAPPRFGRLPRQAPFSHVGWVASTRTLARLDRPPSFLTA